MEVGDAILFAVIAALAANSVLFLWPGWDRRRAIFYTVQVVNLLVAIFLMAVGVPSLDGSLEIFNWVIGGLFIVRIVSNNNRYADALRKRGKVEASRLDDKRAAIQAALRRGEQRSGSEIGSATAVPVGGEE